MHDINIVRVEIRLLYNLKFELALAKLKYKNGRIICARFIKTNGKK